MITPQNPPAFPLAVTEWSPGQEGMSLRDWFAGQYLTGLRAYYAGDEAIETEVRKAYRYADAMLKVRTENPWYRLGNEFART